MVPMELSRGAFVNTLAELGSTSTSAHFVAAIRKSVLDRGVLWLYLNGFVPYVGMVARFTRTCSEFLPYVFRFSSSPSTSP